MARGKAAGRYTPRRRGDDGASNRWIGTYADAVTLLMAFFVMLYSMSQIDIVKFEAFVKGLQVPFGNPAASQGLLQGNPSMVADAPAPGAEMPPDVRPEPVALAGEPVEPDPESQQPDEAERDRDLAQLERVRVAISASLEAEKLDEVAQYRYDERGLVVSIAADDVLFATGSTQISPLGRRIIAAVAEPLAQFSNDIVVEGHTDNVPLQRNGYTNWNLSTDRAVAVLSLLYSDFGLRQDRLGAAGYGEFRPQLPNDTPEHRASNRRVDVLVVAQGA